MNNENNVAIAVNNLSKTFKIPHNRISTLRGAFVSAFKNKAYEKFKALDKVSFEVKKGEFFGIIGRNGSGKSTLLKLLASIYTPDTGRIKINGRVSPFLELGIGFNPELSGRDNIYLNATVLGLTRKQIEEKFAKIVAFSELERFIDQKIKNYSSGMQVRLAFSVAIHANRDILLMDEVLAVGDTNFQQKCLEEFNKYRKQGRTVILVTHDMGTVQRHCDRALLLRNGKVVLIGNPLKAVEKYVNQNMSDEENRIEKNSENTENNNSAAEPPSAPVSAGKTTNPRPKKAAKITRVTFLDKNGKPKNVFGTGEDIIAKIHYQSNKKILKPVVGIAIYTQGGIHLTGPNTRTSHHLIDKMEGKGSLDFVIKNNPFYSGTYALTVALYDWECVHPYDIKDRAYQFKIFSKEENQLGTIKLNHLWKN